MKLTIPELSLVVLIGPSGSGKSTFARTHFKSTEVLSSDFCRGLVSDDENDQSATPQAFEVLEFIAAKRLAAGKLTVIDATNVQAEARKSLLELARTYHTLATAIVFNLPEKLCYQRNAQRPDRNFGSHVIHRQMEQMRRSLHSLRNEGFHHIYTLRSPEEVESVEIEPQRLWSNLKHEHGPFDIIGDIHGCFPELQALLHKLAVSQHEQAFSVVHPQGRKLLFLGDLVDRGPDTPNVLRLVMDAVATEVALCVPGNHDIKLMRKLKGHNVTINHGLAESLAQIGQQPPAFKERVIQFLDGLISHYVLDDGKLVVAHAGMKETMQGRGSRAVREFALYGETTGETDEFGLPIRYDWAAGYRGKAMVVYGHTPVPSPDWLNNTINIDTGCVFGGNLTALRYPEKELVAVHAAWTYSEPAKPFLVTEPTTIPILNAQQQHDDILDIEDVTGKRLISTRLNKSITIREENAIAALEVMSRFAANPKWLIYLPPTMSPCGTSKKEGLLEHPAEAFAYYRQEGISRVICEQKHMGSRAVVIVCKNEEAAQKHFGVVNEGIGICYTRTGRRFFDDTKLEAELLRRLRTALDIIDFWGTVNTDWLCLDCELMPWSVKAQSLVLQQYAAVGAASRASLHEAVTALTQAGTHNSDMQLLLNRYIHRQDMAMQYVHAYRNYCWPVNSISDLKLAPFHLIAAQDRTFFDDDHTWHMDMIERICKEDSNLLLATPYKVVELEDENSITEAIAWWEQLTGRGGEGMVVKPYNFTGQGKRGIVQPAVKCRGPEYLRIIYGPEYDTPENLEQLRLRSLGAKRSLAMREFALGVEAVERFVHGEPLRRVHECVFGVLALESEPVDPRL